MQCMEKPMYESKATILSATCSSCSSLLARTFHPQATMWYPFISQFSTPQKQIRCRKFKMNTKHDIIRTSSQPYLVSLRFDVAVLVSCFANVFQNRKTSTSLHALSFSLSTCMNLVARVGVHL